MFALAGNKWNTTLPGGNMQFQGVIIAETCRIEAGDKQMTVNMGQISSNRFHAVGEDREGANKQVISSQADSLIKISRIWADFFPVNTSNQPI